MSRDGIVYVHYGCSKFEQEKFNPIKNIPLFNKPSGGFWASSIDAKRGWKQWNQSSHHSYTREDNKVEFRLKEDARVLELHSVKDARAMKTLFAAPLPEELKRLNNENGIERTILCSIDFEAIAKEYDAIEYFLSDDPGLYDELYGWDCDSIVILNPDIVIQLEERQMDKNIVDSVLEDIEIKPKEPTYKQNLYDITEDVLEEDEHGQLSFMSYLDDTIIDR